MHRRFCRRASMDIVVFLFPVDLRARGDGRRRHQLFALCIVGDAVVGGGVGALRA